MMFDHAEMVKQARARRRFWRTLAAAAAVAALGVAVIVTVRDQPAPPAPAPSPPPRPPAAPEPGWDVAAQRELADRPMPWFPVDAADPTILSDEAAGPPLQLPAAAFGDVGALPAEGLPPTPEGALAQLVILNEAGTRGGDPARYQHSYRTLSAPGAPDVGTTGLYTLLAQFRKSAGLAHDANPPGLSVVYEVTHGLIKGTVDQGRYVVACVLGQMTFAYQGRPITLGVGDCQALRRIGEVWRISPGPVPAYASNTWPGSAECVRAGYRAVIR